MKRKWTSVDEEDVIIMVKKTAGNSAFGIIEDEFVGQFRFPVSMITWLDMKERVGRVWDNVNILNLGYYEA